jgi:hypothetical protein
MALIAYSVLPAAHNFTLNIRQDGRRDVTKALLLPSIFIHMHYVVSLYKTAADSAKRQSVTMNPTTPPDYV